MPLILKALRPTGLAARRELGLVACLLIGGCVAPPSGPEPSITQLAPSAVCGDQAAQVEIEGHNFAPAQTDSGGALRLPSVQLLRLGTSEQALFDGASSQAVHWSSATSMRIDLAALGLRAGLWQVQVQNPGGGHAVAATPLWVQGTPTVDNIAGDDGCANVPHDRLFTLSGSNFVIQGDTPPTVQLDGQPLRPSWDASTCTQPTGDQRLSVCTRLTLSVPASFSAGSHTLTVQNPAQATVCSNAAATAGLEIAGVVPKVAHPTAPGSVSLCAGGGALAINGNYLSPGASVRIGTSAAPLVTGSSCVANLDSSCGTIVANFGAITAASPASLTVQNPGSCAVQMDAVVNVLPGPQLYAVDPPVVYDDMPNSLTLFLHGLTGAVTTVTASAPGSATALTLCGGSSSPCTTQALQSSVAGDQALALTLPAGSLVSLAGAAAQAAVTLEVRTADSTCSALLPAGLLVANAQVDTALAVSPASAQAGSQRVITITTTDPHIAPGARLYYAGAGVHGAFTQAAFVDSRTLTAVVPAVALSGAFADVDVVLVNLDGTVYVQPQGLRLIATAMPLLTDTNGASVSSRGGALSTQAANLDTNSTAALVGCSDKAGQPQPNVPLGLALSNSTLTLTVPAVAVAPQRCQLMVTRSRDGAQTQGGAVFLSDDAKSLPTTRNGQQPLRAARRGHGLAATISDADLHSIVVAGGDNGQQPLSSVEIAPITASGALGPWVLSPYSLHTARTGMSLLRVGSTTIYALGGTDAAGNGVTTVERAVVLNANDAPTSLHATAFAYGTAGRTGLAAGAWSYAVALLYGSTDALYPCGESLASAPFTLGAPSVPSGYIPTLAWSVPSNHRPLRGVRIYRSAVNGGSTSLRWFADIAASDGNFVFTDASTQGQPPAATCAPPAASQAPLAPGALSPWTQLDAQLTRPRVGGSFAVATHNSSRTSHLLALGGLNNGAPLQDYEVMNLTAVDGTTPDQWEMSQTFTAATLPNVGGTPCAGSTARTQATALVLNVGNSSRDGVTYAVTDESQYLVLGPGLGTVGLPAADGWLVATNGQLQDVGAHVCLSSMAAAAQSVGYAVRGQLAWFGGSVASTGVRTTPWDVNNGTLRITTPESDNGTPLAVPRLQAAGVSHGGYLYITGGAGAPLPQGSVEYGMW